MISSGTSSHNIFQSSLKKYPDSEIIDLDEELEEYNLIRKKNDFVTVSLLKGIVKPTSIVAKRYNASSKGQVVIIASIINVMEI